MPLLLVFYMNNGFQDDEAVANKIKWGLLGSCGIEVFHQNIMRDSYNSKVSADRRPFVVLLVGWVRKRIDICNEKSGASPTR